MKKITLATWQKLDRLIIEINFKLKSKKVRAMPLQIDIEPINRCNFRCDHCQVTHWQKEAARLSLTSFERAISQFPRLRSIKLQGMGEPLLNQQLIPMLKTGEQRGIAMFFHTNGSIGDLKTFEQLAQLKHTHISYSIDGATAATFERIRRGSQFDRVIANISKLAKLRGSNRNLMLSAWSVITASNLSELPQIVRLVKQLGLDRLEIQPQLTTWGKQEQLPQIDNIQLDLESELFKTQLATAQAVAAAEGIELAVNKSNRFSREHPCRCTWESTYIAANGDVIPCSVIADAEIVKMGNVFETDFKDIWNSQPYQTLRTQIANHDLPDHCKHCYLDG